MRIALLLIFFLASSFCKKPDKEYRITFSDSGKGGLFFAQEVKSMIGKDLEKLSANYGFRFVFEHISDTKNFPYSTRPKDELQKIVYDLISYQSSRPNNRLSILACNTASSVVEKEFPRFMKLDDETKKVIEGENFFLVTGTSTTVNSAMYLAGNVLTFAADNWAKAIENNVSEAELEKIVVRDLTHLQKSLGIYFLEIKKVGLFCTHFIKVKPYVQKFFGSHVEVITQGALLSPSILQHVQKDLSRMSKDKYCPTKVRIISIKK